MQIVVVVLEYLQYCIVHTILSFRHNTRTNKKPPRHQLNGLARRSLPSSADPCSSPAKKAR